jgi:uncharacterized protein (TIGR02466 family)
MIHSLFPQAIGFYNLEREITVEEISFIKKQETCLNKGNTTSIDSKILCNEEMTKIREFIETKISEYFKNVYSPKHDINVQITQSWINYTKPKEWHHKHTHPNSFISGVFYPQANKETDKIIFCKDGFQQIKIPCNEWNFWNSETWWFTVGTGDLIIFPSSLAHTVEPVEGEQTRISLSFNTFPVGSIGDEIELYKLQIEKIS